MTSPINTAAIYAYTLPGQKATQMLYNSQQGYEADIYVKQSSNRLTEFFSHAKPLSAAPEKQQGQPTLGDSMRILYNFSATHKFFGTYFPITFEALVFNRYDREFPQSMKNLAQSHTQTKNRRAIEPLVNGFSSTSLTYDGQPLFSPIHPTGVGTTYSNTIGIPTQYDEAALEDIEISLSGMVDDAGNLITCRGDSIIIGPKNGFNATRVHQNPDRPNTTNRDINALYHMNRFSGGIKVNPFFGPEWDDWYIKTTGSTGISHGEGALHLEAVPLRIDPHADEINKQIMWISYEAYLYIIWNNRQFFGVQGLN